MVPFSEALRIVLAHSPPSREVELVPLAGAFRRVLAEDIIAREDIPIADNSAMDGYAVRAADVAAATPEWPAVLDVLEVLAANRPATGSVGPGQAMKIMTGAPIPPGANAIVMVEQTRSEGGKVWIKRPAAAGEHFRGAGGDIRRGAVALKTGTRLSPAHVGMLASLGYPDVPVVRRPRVGILATGDEIIPPTEPLKPGKVRNANSYTLLGLAREAGADPRLLGIAPDDRAALKRTVDSGLAEHDILITSGGVSMGDFDFVKPLADEIGVQVHYRAINIKPGKPVVFGTRGAALFFGLPGNPVSSMVTFLQLVRPAILRRMGQSDTALRTLYAPAAHPLKKTDDKRHFLRAVLHPAPEGGLQVRLTGDQGSGLLSSMGYANCFVILDEQTMNVPAGQPVEVQLFDGEPLPAG